MTSTADLVSNSVPDLAHNGGRKRKGCMQMSMGERIQFVRDVITIEPLLCCYLMATQVCLPALLNLEFEKACKSNHDYNNTICDAIIDGSYAEKNFTTQQFSVQETVVTMHSWNQPLQSIMPIILVLFLGSYSDRHQMRKPFLLIPILGEFLAVAGCIACVAFMREWSVEVLGIAQTVVPSVFGGPAMITMAAFAYISDISSVEMRTLRIGIVQFVLSICVPIAQSFSGILFEMIGYIGVLLVGGGLFLIGLVYGYICIREPKQPDPIDGKGLLKDVFDPHNAIETVLLLTRKKKGNRRLSIVLIMVLLFIYVAVTSGEISLFYPYTTIFHIDILQFSAILTTNTIVHNVGTAIGVPLFTWFHINDLTILFLCILDKIVTNAVFASIPSLTGIYIASFVSIIGNITTIAIRSQASKAIAEDDMGKAQSLFAIVDAVASATAIPIYNQLIYSPTKQTFPQAFFLFGIILLVLANIIVVILYVYEKRTTVARKRKTRQQAESGIELENGKNSKVIEITHM